MKLNIRTIIVYSLILFLMSVSIVSAQTSPHYSLKNFEFGGGGGVNVDSNSYSMEGIVGQIADSVTSNSYGLNSGLIYAQQANVPSAPTLENTGSWYNKLLLKIDNGNNPTDATFAIAISPDDFVTTYYVQSDNTISATLGPEDYQTYANWGGASGEYIIGLNANTTYKAKVKASQGKFTESGWGPTSAGVATSNSSISFDIDIGTSSTADTNAPYSVDVGQLTPGSVTTASNQVWVDLDTNADYGGYVYIYDQYAGLKSLVSNHTITSSSTDLSSATEGYGIQIGTATQTSGGPLAAIAPYNGSTENVGVVDSTVRELFHTTSGSIVGGRGSFYVKAKSSSVTPASNDYTDTLTLIAAATF